MVLNSISEKGHDAVYSGHDRKNTTGKYLYVTQAQHNINAVSTSIYSVMYKIIQYFM